MLYPVTEPTQLAILPPIPAILYALLAGRGPSGPPSQGH